MRRNRNSVTEEANEIDLTPMLDVVFIMLIFFIVTTSFVKEAGVEVNRPQAASAEKKENTSIFVAIKSNDEVWIDKRPIDIRAVRANIERLHAENPDGGVVIQADDESKTGLLVKVIDQILLAGIPQSLISVAAEGSE